MTGWYVRILLEYSARVRAGKENGEEISTDLTDNLYDDLLSVEMAIKRLKKENSLTKLESRILELLPSNVTNKQMAKILHVSNEWLLEKTIEDACSKIAFCLGDHFTDDGFISYMIKKYNLKLQDGLIIDTLIHKNYHINDRKVTNV